ncbi:Parasporal protein [Sporosarcina sp. P12(2017)]|uniref:S-layer homology domain-containing protein n=1 Tax=unclassified Sporosarcina TaxID=2647733 RepID=UPI000C172FEF|nr:MULTISPECIES: S-layer homology domain-containing protein [unclassified Sporosarcina]PIC56668.1 Parasporal protein [Sporosarcina sp. P10]PIC59885.1 Parasporal protein [Sporosarcina sp. P12(2017)]
MIRKLLTIVGALLLACSLSLSGTAASKQPFPDVPSTKHFAEAVNELATRNIIGGYPDGTFKPGNNITRGQAAAIIVKMIKLDMNHVKNPGFKDVSKANGYYNAIAALAEAGIIGGYEDGRYGPNDPVKRGQFASILVKAFDLPRYDFYGMKNPFKDIAGNQSHSANILILHRLGITGGIAPDRFGLNQPVTRGQAAKMMKAAEDGKPAMISFTAEELGMDGMYSVIWKENQDVYESIVTRDTAYGPGRLQLIALKEGTATLNVSGYNGDSPMNEEEEIYRKYYVHVKKTDDGLKLSIEQTDDYLPTEAPLELSKTEKIKKISLYSATGDLLDGDASFHICKEDQKTCITIRQPGKYYAVAQLANGEEIRYAIQMKEPEHAYFHYDMDVLRERPSYTFNVEELFEKNGYYDKKAARNIGKHTIVTKNAENIATIKRDPHTNVFHVTAKKVGTVEVKFENPFYFRGEVGDGVSGMITGMEIKVRDLNGLIHISASQIYELNY